LNDVSDSLTVWAPGIFEGWIWRILVDRVFKAHDGERWEGYGAMVKKLEREWWLVFNFLEPNAYLSPP
jgi:hypothetical protein